MSLINSLFAGVSGLRNHQSMMDVIGNNIANVNSIGFKGSRVTFADTFNTFVKAGTNPTETSGGTNTFQIGLGSKINSIDRNWAQGTFDRTGVVTDLALQGNGMFVLKSQGVNYYSRAGAFTFDANGNLVNPQNGAIVQGKMANQGILPSGNSLTDIKVDNNLRLPAIATTEAKWTGNLNSNANLTQTEHVIQGGSINTTIPSGGSGVPDPSIDTTKIYDQNGKAYTLTTTYTCTNAADPKAFAYTLSYDITDETGVSVVGGPQTGPSLTVDTEAKTITPTAPSTTTLPITDTSGAIKFDLNFANVTVASTSSLTSSADNNRQPNIVSGSVTVFDSLGNAHNMTIKFTKTADNQWNWNVSLPTADYISGSLSGNSGKIQFNPDGSIQQGSIPTISFAPTGGAKPQSIQLDFGSGVAGITQTSGSSSISVLSQDGAAAATLSNLNIDQYGNVVGVFSNGKTQTLAQIMVATFKNQQGLVSVGDNMYNISANSGDPLFGAPGSDTGTTLQSGALEQSNVDLSEEFTKMIVSQRGFQANARVVTTADTLLQEITNLIR